MYITLLQGVLKEVASVNRETQRGYAWFLLIPLFNLVWAFIFYIKLANSIKNEFESRGKNSTSDYGKGLGVALAITGVLGFIPYVGLFFGIGNLVLWIFFWVIIARYKSDLVNSEKGNYRVDYDSDLLDN